MDISETNESDNMSILSLWNKLQLQACREDTFLRFIAVFTLKKRLAICIWGEGMSRNMWVPD